MITKNNSNSPHHAGDPESKLITSGFDQMIDRAGSHSVKYDERQNVFGKSDVIPLWVADMDFAAPPAITEALVERARHPIYGYTCFPESLYEGVMRWMKKRHGWTIKREWIVLCPAWFHP